MKRMVITIGDRVRHAREKLGMSQYELATKAGIRAETVSRLERGKNKSSLIALHKVAPVLGQSIDYFVGGKPARKPGKKVGK